MTEHEGKPLSRRELVGLGIGMADRLSEPKMDDPRSKYPKAPFRAQTQAWPGLARNMDPKPDHGETTYRGSGRLTGRKALITGGDSGMGRAAATRGARHSRRLA